jgi:hypothetical protein
VTFPAAVSYLGCMRRLASCLLVAGLVLVGAGCGSSKKHAVYVTGLGGPVHGSKVVEKVPKGVRVGPGPFLFWGASGGGQSGMFGDGGDGPHGTSIGCLNGRRYNDAVGIQNGTKVPLRLTAASGPRPDPRVVDRVAIQLHLSPPYHPRPAGSFVDTSDLVYHRWSAAAAKPVTIPPHRIATVQRNFLLHNCREIGEGRGITIPGTLVVRYLRSGHEEKQRMPIRGSRLVVVHGPTKHTCTPISGSASLLTSDVTCAFASRAAPLCRAMHNGGWLGCTVDGRYWECGRFAGPGFPLFETCYLPHDKSHWFSIVWVAPGLGLWGAIQNRRANIGWPRLDAWHTSKGICEDRPAGLGLVFESSALPILSGRYSTRIPADARVKFVVRGYGGPGSFSVDPATVQVTVQRRGKAYRSYLATAGKLTVTHASRDSISGTVYANLRQKNGKKESQLNGTWTCSVGTG